MSLFLRYSTIVDAEKHLKEGETLILGGFPSHIVTAHISEDGSIVLGVAEDEVQAQVKQVDESLSSLVHRLANRDEAATVDNTLQLIASLGYNL